MSEPTTDGHRLWRTYAIAPAVAPLSFCVLLALPAAACVQCDRGWYATADVGTTSRRGSRSTQEGEPSCE